MKDLDVIITARERDVGGFTVRRILPYGRHRMVGPFIFFDHMGPASFLPGNGVDVRPHPHIHLATVTYLFEGTIRHRDSLGSNQLIEPGAINWMTAGHGIVHSERTPTEIRSSEHRLEGIQCWVALPAESEAQAPSFSHHPAVSLPDFRHGPARIRLLLGHLFDQQSPVRVHSDIFYADVQLTRGERITLPAGEREQAAYLVHGQARVNGSALSTCAMAIGRPGSELTLEAVADARFMILGGRPLGERFIFWNFVSSTQAAIEKAKADWLSGPAPGRFSPVPGDDTEYIPLPAESGRAKGTVM